MYCLYWLDNQLRAERKLVLDLYSAKTQILASEVISIRKAMASSEVTVVDL